MLRQTGKLPAMIMSPRTADVDINIEPPSDPSRQSTQQHSRAPSRHSRRSSGGRYDDLGPSPQAQMQQTVQQQLPGITVNINPDGSTTISIVSCHAVSEDLD